MVTHRSAKAFIPVRFRAWPPFTYFLILHLFRNSGLLPGVIHWRTWNAIGE
jgi:hypothetical protein